MNLPVLHLRKLRRFRLTGRAHGAAFRPDLPRRLKLEDDRGATALEWTLLLAAVAIPSYWMIKQALILLTDYYRMMTTLNGLPFP